MKLGVNIDHVATLRQARGGKDPDPAKAAQICEMAGADSVVMHLREDRRHIQDADLFKVKRVVSLPLNLEMSIAPSIVRVAEKLKPFQATFVPEKRKERTTEGGLNLFEKSHSIERAIRCLQEQKIAVSLFLDPDLKQIDRAKKLGVEAIELHTGDYANQKNAAGVRRELERLRAAAAHACQMGLTAHAGHGLDYQNVAALVKIKNLTDLNIGYAIITHAVWVGLEEAVRQMKALVST